MSGQLYSAFLGYCKKFTADKSSKVVCFGCVFVLVCALQAARPANRAGLLCVRAGAPMACTNKPKLATLQWHFVPNPIARYCVSSNKARIPDSGAPLRLPTKWACKFGADRERILRRIYRIDDYRCIMQQH